MATSTEIVTTILASFEIRVFAGVAETKQVSKGYNLKLDTIVFLKEDNLPPLQWALDQVSALYSGPDGVV